MKAICKKVLIFSICFLFLYPFTTKDAHAEFRDKTAFIIQKHRPWGDPDGGMQTQAALPFGKFEYTASVGFHFSSLPLVGFDREERRIMAILNYQIASNINVGFGVTEWFELWIDVPFTLDQQGRFPGGEDYEKDAQGASTVLANQDLTGTFLSDIRIGMKFHLIESLKKPYKASIFLAVGFPTSYPWIQQTRRFNGGGYSGLFMLLGSYELGFGSAHGNLGYRFNMASSFFGKPQEHELIFNAGILARVHKGFALFAEFYSSFFVPEVTALTSHAELTLGLRVMFLNNRLGFKMGAGVPLSSGIGTPTVRVLTSLIWYSKARWEE